MFTKKVLNQLSSPSLLLDLVAFDENCRQIANQANGKMIRVATKSIRSIPVLKRILQSDPVYQGLMSFSPHEAIFLAKKGFTDILLGYPCTDKKALIEISKINLSEKQIILMVDSLYQLDLLEAITKETSGMFYLCIDIDMSTTFGNLHFGVRRSPLKTEKDVLELAEKIKESSSLQLLGIMGYEAQIAGVGDHIPSQYWKNKLISFLKKKSLPKIEARRINIVRALEDAGFSISLVNGGGTGSLQTTTKENCITEVTVGSGFYSPLLFDYYQDFSYKPALHFALPVVRKPTPNIYTCLGGGYIASGAIGKDKVPQPVYPRGGKLLPLEGAGEVQTPVYFEKEILEIGDVIVFRAAKAGEICERFNDIVLIENQKIVDNYKTYRGEGVSFL